MTKKQFTKKFNELKRTTAARITELSDKALKSGAIDLDSWEDNYVLPKIVMTAICRELVNDWKPLDKDYRKESINLQIFLQKGIDPMKPIWTLLIVSAMAAMLILSIAGTEPGRIYYGYDSYDLDCTTDAECKCIDNCTETVNE